jgi:pyruvate-formate lyase
MGPRPGADHNGLTAMLNSVAKLPLHKGVGGTTLNVTVTTKHMATAAQRANVAAVIKTFMNGGGQMAQINTACLEDLLDAREHPERHGDLIVRVGGYSIQFVQLNKKHRTRSSADTVNSADGSTGGCKHACNRRLYFGAVLGAEGIRNGRQNKQSGY